MKKQTSPTCAVLVERLEDGVALGFRGEGSWSEWGGFLSLLRRRRMTRMKGFSSINIYINIYFHGWTTRQLRKNLLGPGSLPGGTPGTSW